MKISRESIFYGFEWMVVSATDVILDPIIRTSPLLPYPVQNGIHDALLGFSGVVAAKFFYSLVNESGKYGKVLLPMIVLFGGETLQGLQQHFGKIEGGFAWEDYLAYSIGIVAAVSLNSAASRFTRLANPRRLTYENSN